MSNISSSSLYLSYCKEFGLIIIISFQFLKKKLENLKENFTKENLEKIIEDFDYNEVF